MAVVPGPGGHIHVMRNGRKRWGTDDPPVQLIPDAWQSIPVTIEFPDFAKDVAYRFGFVGSGQLGMSIVKMLPAETTLPDLVLGSVPAGVNYVDWRVQLSWVKQPSQTRFSPAFSPVRPGAQCDLRGGSALIEVAATWRRLIQVQLVGTSIVLKRRQSARNMTETVAWSPGNATHYPSGGPQPGWTYGVMQAGALVHPIATAQGGNNVWRGASNGASLVDPTDYSSIWTGTLLVKPGRYNTSI